MSLFCFLPCLWSPCFLLFYVFYCFLLQLDFFCSSNFKFWVFLLILNLTNFVVVFSLLSLCFRVFLKIFLFPCFSFFMSLTYKLKILQNSFLNLIFFFFFFTILWFLLKDFLILSNSFCFFLNLLNLLENLS